MGEQGAEGQACKTLVPTEEDEVEQCLEARTLETNPGLSPEFNHRILLVEGDRDPTSAD